MARSSGGWLSDVFIVGALGSGVNFATLMAINFVTFMAVLSLLFLLITVWGDPELVPHVIVLLVFAAGQSPCLGVHSCDLHGAHVSQMLYAMLALSRIIMVWHKSSGPLLQAYGYQ